MEKAKRAFSWGRWLKGARAFFEGTPFMIFETFVAFLFAAFEQEQMGAFFFVSLMAIQLMVCEDILVTTLPFLLVATFATRGSLDFLNTFKNVLIIAPPAIAAFIFHFVVYHKPIYGGESGFGLGLVSVAVTLGGVGRYAIGEYLHWAYYVIGLGVGMFLAYFLMKSQFSVRFAYDVRKRFSKIMLFSGIYCAALVVYGYIRKLTGLPMGVYQRTWVSPNNVATMLMFSMPFPMYLAREKFKKWLIIFTPLFYTAIIATVSRGGILMGGVEFAVITLVWLRGGKWDRKKTVICIVGGVAMLGVVIACWDTIVLRFFETDWTKGARFKMIKQAYYAFKDGPLFGTGILDTSLEFEENRAEGMLCWYHMMIPQVVGSMGLIGIAAYGRQILDRFRLIFKRMDAWALCLGVSYLGILLMSQVNPGEFCPVPFCLMSVILFIMQERRLTEQTLPIAKSYFTTVRCEALQ